MTDTRTKIDIETFKKNLKICEKNFPNCEKCKFYNGTMNCESDLMQQPNYKKKKYIQLKLF